MKRRSHRIKEKADLERHAFGRCAQRLGFFPTQEELDEVVRKIQMGDGEFLFTQSLTRTHWNVTIRGVVARVVYDKKRKAIVTVLPIDA